MNNKSKIHILHAIRQGKIGGGETYVLQLIRGLDSNRFCHSVISFTDGPMVDNLRQMGITVFVISVRHAFHVLSWFRLIQILRLLRPDMIHVHGTRAASNLIPLAKWLRIPVIYTIHGWSFHPGQGNIQFLLRRLAEQCITLAADVNVNVSTSDQIAGYRYLFHFRSIVIHNGVDLHTFKKLHSNNHFKDSIKTSMESILISFIARMTDQKNPFLLLEAFRLLLNRTDKEVLLLMVGDGELLPHIRLWIQHHSLDKYIRLFGFRQDVVDILSASQIYCLPSLWEGLPIGLLEAMAMENAVVASDIPQHREIVSHGVNGLLFHPGDVEDLAQCLFTLCESEDKRLRLQKSARILVENCFDIKQTLQQTEELYEYLVNNGHRYVYAS